MPYEPFYPDGWKNDPDETTPISAEALTHLDDGIATAETTADWDAVTGKPSTFPATVPVASATVAASADKLTTARNIALTGDVTGSASFNGTANASITAAIGAGVIVNADVSASAAIAGTKVAIADDSENQLVGGNLQDVIAALAYRVYQLEQAAV